MTEETHEVYIVLFIFTAHSEKQENMIHIYDELIKLVDSHNPIRTITTDICEFSSKKATDDEVAKFILDGHIGNNNVFTLFAQNGLQCRHFP